MAYNQACMGKKVKITVDVTELGRKGGQARAAAMSAEEMSEAGRTAVNARWDEYYRQHPEKLAERQNRDAARLAAAKRRAKKAGKKK